MLEKAATASTALSAWEAAVGPTVPNQPLQMALDQTRNMVAAVQNTASDVRRRSINTSNLEHSTYGITLDDAVDALCDIKADEDIETGKRRIRDDEYKDESYSQKKGTMMGKRKEYQGAEPFNVKRYKPYIPAGTGKKKDSVCHACKKVGHWKGDFVCEENSLQQQWAERNEKKSHDANDKNVATNQSAAYFQ